MENCGYYLGKIDKKDIRYISVNYVAEVRKVNIPWLLARYQDKCSCVPSCVSFLFEVKVRCGHAFVVQGCVLSVCIVRLLLSKKYKI